MLFSQTVTASQLRDKLKDFLSGVSGRNVLQILHRGQPIRVLMTQEYYLTLLAKIAALETRSGQDTVAHQEANELGRKIAEAADQHLAAEGGSRLGKRANG